MKIFDGFHLAVQILDFLAQEIAHSPAFFSATGSQKSLDLIQRKTQLLSLFDELDALNGLRAKETKVAGRASGARQKLQPFVITHGVDAYASSSCLSIPKTQFGRKDARTSCLLI